MKFCNLSEKDLNLKFMLKGRKTIKIMKGSKNRRGLTQVRAIYVFFLHINKQEYRYIMTTRKFTLKVLFLAVL